MYGILSSHVLAHVFIVFMCLLVVLFAMLLSVSVVISLGWRLLSWCIIKIQDTDMSFLMLFTTIKQGMFESIQASQELRAAKSPSSSCWWNSRDTNEHKSYSVRQKRVWNVWKVCEVYCRKLMSLVLVHQASQTQMLAPVWMHFKS